MREKRAFSYDFVMKTCDRPSDPSIDGHDQKDNKHHNEARKSDKKHLRNLGCCTTGKLRAATQPEKHFLFSEQYYLLVES
jgi:hypothetical protein